MGQGRNCPQCGGIVGYWDTYMPGRPDSSFCRGCGTTLLHRIGPLAILVRYLLPFGLAAGAYFITRPMPIPWSLIGFLLLFVISAVPVAMLFRWYLLEYAELTPATPKPPPKDEAAGNNFRE